ncbi:MAG: hypothetical protein L3K05_07145, partial [Thermoplasmata archaeon]|nr:hypothetical protein [Thermoplasmata archaeon]
MEGTAPSEPSPHLPRWPDPLETAAVLTLLVVAVGVLEYYYAFFPVPPGVDPGDWIQRSYGWVGLAHPPAYAVGSPFLYPPLLFPILGALRLATGSPLQTGFAFGGLVLGAYGLSLWYLARATIARTEFRVALVGLGLLNGTVISMLFWGGYPNFLAFCLFDLAIATLVLYLRRPGTWRGVALGGFVALTYLAHTLTFDLLVATVVLAFVGSIALRRLPWRSVLARGLLAGLAIVIVTDAVYSEALNALGIPRINYLYADPPAFTLSGLGTVFVPLTKSPAFFPMGPEVDLTARAAAAILGIAGVGVLVLVAWAARRRPDRWRFPALIAAAWSGVVLLAPVGGYVAHVATDYTRFVYFLPLPLSLLAITSLEALLPRALVAAPAPDGSRASSELPRSRFRLLRPAPFRVLAIGIVAVGLAALLVNVTIPTVALAEHGDAGSTHDAQFLAGASYLSTNPTAGSVLTVEGTARWIEALTDRGAFDPGPTWLLYENWQIADAQEAYFAMNSASAVTNNLLVASYSGYATTSVSQAPMVSAIVLGVPVPMLRVLPASEMLDAAGANCTGWSPASTGAPPTLEVPTPTGAGQVRETNGCATTVQTTTLAAGSPTLWVNYTVTPSAGASVLGFNVTLASPPTRVAALHIGSVSSLTSSGGKLAWDVSTHLGALPTNATVDLTGATTPAPRSETTNITNGSGTLTYGFANPNPSSPFSFSIALTVPTASNPAIVLPTVLDTSEFLAALSIRFLFLPATVAYTQTVDFLATTFHFVTVYSNT